MMIRGVILKFSRQLTMAYYFVKKRGEELTNIKCNYFVIADIFHVVFELALADCMSLPRFVERNCGQHHWHSSKRTRESAKAGVGKKKCQRW